MPSELKTASVARTFISTNANGKRCGYKRVCHGLGICSVERHLLEIIYEQLCVFGSKMVQATGQ